jgi:PAS domain S-box-containing protein
MSLDSRWPVTARYALLPAASVLLVTLILLALVRWLAVEEDARRTQLRLQYRATVLANAIDDHLRGSVREMRLLARSPLMSGAVSAPKVRAELDLLLQQSPNYVWIGLIGLDGTVLAGTRGWLEGQSLAARPVFRQSRTGTWLGDVHPAVALAQLMKASGRDMEELIDIGEPVRDADGKVVAVLAAHLGVGWIDQLRARTGGESAGRPVPSIGVYLVSGTGSRNVLPGELAPEGLPATVGAHRDAKSIDGRHYFAATQMLQIGSEVSPLPWRVLVLQERGAALASSTALMGAMAAGGGLAAVAVALIGGLWARQVLRPWGPVFDKVIERAQGEAGDLTSREGIEALLNELGTNPTSRSGAEKLVARLAHDARALRRVVDQLPLGVAMIDRQWRVEYLNPAYTRLLGWTTEQVQGRVTGEFLLDAVERESHVRMIEHLGMAPGEVAARFDALTPGGQRVAVQWNLVPLMDAEDRLDGAIVVVHDLRAERLALARADALAGRLRALAEAAVDTLLATVDSGGQVLEWSRGAERLTGQTAADAMQRPIGDLLQGGSSWPAWLVDARRHGACPVDAELMTGDGRLRWFEGSLYALGLASGPARLGLILRDVTERREAEFELERSRARLAHIINTMAEGLTISDASGRFVMFNEAAARICGVDGNRMIGLSPSDAPWKRRWLDTGEAVGHPHAELMAGGPDLRDAQWSVERADGTLRAISLNTQVLRDPHGRIDGVVATFVDITDRHLAQQALRDSQSRLAAVVDSASDAIVSTDLDGRITLFNPAAERIFGVDAAAMAGAGLERLLPQAMRPRHRSHIQGFARSGQSRRAMAAGVVKGVHADGRLLDLEASISQAQVGGQTVLTAILRDVTERVAQDRALEVTRAELLQLTRQLLEQEKQTTRRLAQALHDELGQTLTALRLHWEALRDTPPVLAGPVAERVNHLVDTSHRQIRSVLSDLRPPLLDDFGLVAALDNEMQQHRPVSGVPALRLDVAPRLQAHRWPADVEYAAFMVAREALLNALHHARAGQVTVSIEGDEGELQLRVQDDGLGIEPPARAGRAGHLGLVGMRERALAIGAVLGLASPPGRGTIVTLTWTLSDEPALPDR